MKIISVNVGLPREVVWKGMTVQTGIFKDPVDKPVTIGIEGACRKTCRDEDPLNLGSGIDISSEEHIIGPRIASSPAPHV